ncbi:hypothetical protein AAIH51_35295, partial [Pseudomonas aeruginosa]
MFNTRSVLALVVSLSLIGGTPAVLADPGNGKGNPHGNQMDGGKGNKGNKGNQGGHDNHGGPGRFRFSSSSVIAWLSACRLKNCRWRSRA